MKTKTVLIYSGGMDSTVLLYWLRGHDHTIKALGVNYGQRHGRELASAELICRELGVPFEVADLSGISKLIAGQSSQVNPNVAVPLGHYAEESMKATVVPNRNMIMLSVAIGHAISLEYDQVAYAAHAGDHTIYPDCRPQFAAAMDLVASLCDWRIISLIRPFIQFTKADIARKGNELGVPFEKTWSCYQGGDVHCGQCGTCVERRESFSLAGIPDPTVYTR